MEKKEWTIGGWERPPKFELNGADHLTGATDGIWGDASGIWGDATAITGCVTGLKGDVSNISGNVCRITGEIPDDLQGCVSLMAGDISPEHLEIETSLHSANTIPFSSASIPSRAPISSPLLSDEELETPAPKRAAMG